MSMDMHRIVDLLRIAGHETFGHVDHSGLRRDEPSQRHLKIAHASIGNAITELDKAWAALPQPDLADWPANV